MRERWFGATGRGAGDRGRERARPAGRGARARRCRRRRAARARRAGRSSCARPRQRRSRRRSRGRRSPAWSFRRSTRPPRPRPSRADVRLDRSSRPSRSSPATASEASGASPCSRSSSPSGPSCPWAQAEIGAIATQAWANPVRPGRARAAPRRALGGRGRERSRRRTTAAPQRQLGVVDGHGRAATYTGTECFDIGGPIGRQPHADTADLSEPSMAAA